MSRTLNQREKVLSLIVGGIVFIGLNYLIFSYFAETHAQLRRDLANKQKQVSSMQSLLANAALWQQRDQWLRAHQPKLENEATAGVQVLNQVQEIARGHNVTVESPALSNPERRGTYTSVAVTMETKSTWQALHEFLAAVQGPELFLVVESANLRIDPSDQTQMRARFRIAKWFAP